MSLIERQILETLERFAANVVHEINSPLGTALAATNIALRLSTHESHSQIHEWLLRSAASIRAASNVAHGLQRICLSSVGDEELCELRDVARIVAEVTQGEARTQRCQIDLIPIEAPSCIIGNPRRIVLALLRVIYCAIDSGIDHIALHTRESSKVGELCISLLPNQLFQDEWRANVGTLVRKIIQSEGGQFRLRRASREEWSIRFAFPVHQVKECLT